MKTFVMVTASLLVAGNTFAQNNLSEQINAIDAAQQQQDLAERSAQRAHARRTAELRAESLSIQKQKIADELADKKRDQAHEDRLRELQVQEKAIQIEAEKARVARQNDFIDQELKAKAAETDVVKSHADVNRNLSEGTKTLLEKQGEAVVKKESGVFR